MEGLGVSKSIPIPLLCESPETRRWDERVAREVEHQARIEAAFDRADALERLSDFEEALAWRARAEALIAGAR
jgi:hypothetical protein